MGKTYRREKQDKAEKRFKTGIDGIVQGMILSGKVTRVMRDRRSRRMKDARRGFANENWE